MVTRWVRWYWDQEDLWFWLEVDAEGWVTRQVELQGPQQTPIAAPSLTEWFHELEAGRIQQYQATYGTLVEQPFSDYELAKCDVVTGEEFEQVWTRARRTVEGSDR